MKKHHNVFAWLDEKIDQCIDLIDNDEQTSKNLKLLDSLISMRKKYDGSMDLMGERIRVLEGFINFVVTHYPKEIDKMERICKKFLEQDS